MPPRTCIYYVTFQCNDWPEFDHVWNDKELQAIGDVPAEKHLPNLKNARKNGSDELFVTGGEPLLYEGLPDFLAAAKAEGYKIVLHTNGIKYMDTAPSIKGLADRTLFSLDYPVMDEHDRSRGTESFSAVIKSINYARETGERPEILYNITRDSVRFLPEMMEIADRLKVNVRLNPVYDYCGLTGFEKESIDYMKYYFQRKNVRLDLAVLEFMKNRGNFIGWPRCRARETTVTFFPDAKRAIPCVHNRGGSQGREQVCIGCTSWPYMLPSFAIGFDRYRLLSAYSGLKDRQKEETK
ncbi:MAG TPA: radical SAM protein [Candidatus Omnitrophota bacterium]|nr:radical SAM protein [Candidatus Omnitrophota bacterium]